MQRTAPGVRMPTTIYLQNQLADCTSRVGEDSNDIV